MPDQVRVEVGFNPLVEVSDNDADTRYAHHHDMGSVISGKMTYNFGANDRWFYTPITPFHNTSVSLFAGTNNKPVSMGMLGVHNIPGEEAEGFGSAHITFTDSVDGDDYVDTDVDTCRFLYIKNLGFTSGSRYSAFEGISIGPPTTNSLYLTMDGSSAAFDAEDAIEIASGEAWCSKFNIRPYKFRMVTGQPDSAGDSGEDQNKASVLCTVVAVINDGGHP